MPGGMISISASGDRRGSAVVWATLPVENRLGPTLARLYAFNADDLTPLWDDQFGMSGHWSPPTIADGFVYVGTGDKRLVAYRLGPPGNRTSWAATQPAAAKCETCHDAKDVEDLHKNPHGRHFGNGAAGWMQPMIAAHQTAPPPETRRTALLEGNGVRTYVARTVRGTLRWALRDATADLTMLSDTRAEPSYSAASAGGPPAAEVRVRLEHDATWIANDGSQAVGRVATTTRAPFSRDLAWTLFRVDTPSRDGVLAGVRYIQLMHTHAGLPPQRPPARPGQTVRVRFVGQYALYR
jgi:hypothetical protein